MRLFLGGVLRAGDEPLTDDETRIAIRVPSHGTRRTEHERCPWGVAFDRVPLGIANDRGMAAMTRSGRVARIDPARDDLLSPRLIFGVREDAPLHPVGSFAVPPVAILPLLRAQVPQVLEDEDGSPLRAGELDNTGTHQMGYVLIHVADLAPEVGIVLFVLRDDASL
jgi:hypothetical protein